MPNARFDRWHEADASCPACGAVGLEHFYQVDEVPTTSNLLMPSRQQAFNWPRGHLRLARCPACGFIANTVFDDSRQQLTSRYEATQACSATFNAFARKLADDWISRYQLRGKRLVEVGCGQGEFLAMLSEMADSPAWGFDPIIDRSRVPASSRVMFLPEKYDATRWAHLAPDFVVCRHTLEHIPNVAGFLREIRRGIEANRQAIVAIEVPDQRRVMNQGAFWDIYYEHCSYFDEVALKSALMQAGFEPLSSRLEFDGQYLIVESRVGTARRNDPPDGSAVDRFVRACGEKIRFWKQELSRVGRRTVIWGSGSKAVGFLTTLGINDAVEAVVDINPAKQGTFLPGSGHEIIAPDRLADIKPDRVIVMNPVYVGEIERSLSRLGVSAEILALS
ncbi:MAG: class I SAM-dependent methyltransferase [Phycisphaerae bacterium]|nr:class I SAM-dependent methyltransferase [Phycisphaerae bacterium]MDW8261373.1 class I SAM-dependent methyltransferase [Phycisphaerales bacterium]